jgi:hypothetical protein
MPENHLCWWGRRVCNTQTYKKALKTKVYEKTKFNQQLSETVLRACARGRAAPIGFIVR